MVVELGRFVIMHPQIYHGAPTIRGTRIPVSDILEALAEGMSSDQIVAELRGDVTREAIVEVIELAAKAFQEKTAAARPMA